MPRTTTDFLNWSSVHAERWQEDPASIGLSPAQAAQFATLAAELKAANLAAVHAREVSKSATLALNDALAATRAVGGLFVSIIKAHAELSGDPNVYARAGVSPAASQSTLPPPTPPRTFASSINTDGSLTITWTARQPVGVTDVVYLVRRRLDGQGSFEIVGNEGANKSFTDTTIPLGTGTVEYLVTPQRGDVVGETGPRYSVRFGSAARGVVGTDAGREVKMAA